MKRVLVIVFLVKMLTHNDYAHANTSSAQASDTRQNLTDMYLDYSGKSYGAGLESTTFAGNPVSLIGAQFTGVFSDRIFMGIAGASMITSVDSSDEEWQYSTRYFYYGLHAEYLFFPQKLGFLGLALTIGPGQISQNKTEQATGERHFTKDDFIYVKPGAFAGVHLSEHAALAFGVSKGLAQQVDLSGYSNSDVSHTSMQVNFRANFF